MENIIINGEKRLEGTITVDSAKNAILAELAACMLCSGEVIFDRCPAISDAENMLLILESLGCRHTFVGDTLIVNCNNASGHEIASHLAREIRSSIFLLGSILGRVRKAKVAYPGGCDIGIRPIDLHLKGLRALNVKISEQNGYILCDGSDMHGGNVHFDTPSVGATENVIMAAVLTRGTTKIENAAKEPEISDLCAFINSMGGKIKGAGTATIEIEGVKELKSTRFAPIPDRIIAGTYLIACAMTGGEMIIKNANAEHLASLICKLQESEAHIYSNDGTITIRAVRPLQSAQIIETLPYPGFPTDLQAQMTALQSISVGTTMIIENMFEGRYKFVPELIKMGANITVRDRMAIVRGVKKLHGAEVCAGDLRGGAALVLAGLAAEGTTVVSNIQHIDRGYDGIEKKFAMLGADIKRVSCGN